MKNKYEDTLSLIKNRADANQRELLPRTHILRALYGSKSQIKKYLKRFEGSMHRIERKEQDSIASNDPYCVADVTIALRFAMDVAAGGLLLERMRTKQNLLGFYNPIPPFKQEQPVLCVVYVLNRAQDEVHIGYYNDREEVKIGIQ